MFSFGSFVHIFLAIVLLFAGVALGFLDLSVGNLIGYVLIAVVFAYVCLMLGRRSVRANAIADEIRTKLDRAEAKLREHGLTLPK